MIKEAAQATGMPYVTTRWMGGTLTNFETIKKSLAKFKKYQAMDASGELGKFSSKEESAIRREMARMTRNFDGIANLTGLPGAMFVIDTSYEEIAVAEAKRVGIPSIGLVDTNSDPTQLTYPIPGNDDAAKSVRIIIETIVEAITQGLAHRENRRNAGAPGAQGEVNLENVAVSADQKGEIVEDKAAAKKRPARSATKKSAVTTDEV
jgi:small subunit ribosomal protein S2